MKEEKESSFFKKVIISIKDFEKYPELASKNWTLVLSYLIKLLLIITIVSSFVYIYESSKEIKMASQFIKNEVPDFTFDNKTLKVKSESVIKKENVTSIFKLIIIDTNQQISEENLKSYKKDLYDNESGIIFLKDKAIIKTNISSENIEYLYSSFTQSYNIEKFNKQDLVQYFSGNNIIMLYIGIFIISFIYVFLINITSIWVDILLLAVFGYLSSLIFMRIRIKFVAMCKIAIHSLTLPIILNIILILIETFTQFKIKYFEIMYIGIVYVYVITAILMIKSDVIKNQQELTKIIEEQNKIKEELEKQEEDKKDKEKEKKEDKKENKEEKKEDKEKEEPQGNNA